MYTYACLLCFPPPSDPLHNFKFIFLSLQHRNSASVSRFTSVLFLFEYHYTFLRLHAYVYSSWPILVPLGHRDQSVLTCPSTGHLGYILIWAFLPTTFRFFGYPYKAVHFLARPAWLYSLNVNRGTLDHKSLRGKEEKESIGGPTHQYPALERTNVCWVILNFRPSIQMIDRFL